MSFQLDLSGNRLTHVGARHLLSQLSGQCLELDLHANRIGAYGCLTISNCILRSSSHELMVLHLGLNDLQDEVSRYVASVTITALENLLADVRTSVDVYGVCR